MDRATDLIAEHAVDELVLLDPAESVEAVGHDLGPEVIAAAGQVLHLYLRAGQGGLDPLLELIRGGHRPDDSAEPPALSQTPPHCYIC